MSQVCASPRVAATSDKSARMKGQGDEIKSWHVSPSCKLGFKGIEILVDGNASSKPNVGQRGRKSDSGQLSKVTGRRADGTDGCHRGYISATAGCSDAGIVDRTY